MQLASKASTVTYVASLVDPTGMKALARLPTMTLIPVLPAAIRRWTLPAVGAQCVVPSCAVRATSLQKKKNKTKSSTTHALHVSERTVVYIGGLTLVKTFLRLRLQNLFSGVCPPIVADGRWFAVVLCCACLRVEVMVSMSARCSKGGGQGFNCVVHALHP